MAFLPQAWIDAAVVPGRHELPSRDGLRYGRFGHFGPAAAVAEGHESS